MKAYDNGAEVSLGQHNYVAAGGEGAIYVVGSTAYKIYSDPSKMLPLGKIQELGALTEPFIIKPRSVLKDRAGKLVGYSMAAVPDSYALCQLFPRAFRDRNHLDHKQTFDLVRTMQGGVEHAHSKRILLVDLNEMNFLVDKGFKQVFFIDVDSYQTPHFPATAIMESIRDRQVRNNDFTDGSDWFSFAVVSFQMLTGIHPYKGKHPQIKGLDARMTANVSVLNPDVNVPRACYPFDVIPQVYRDWYRAVLEEGKRVAPPGTLQAVIGVRLVPQIKTIMGTANLKIIELYRYDGNIRSVWPLGGQLAVVTDNGTWIDQRRIHDTAATVQAIGVSPTLNRVISLTGTPGEVPQMTNLTEKAPIPFGLKVEAAMSYQGRIYIKNGDKVLEVLLHEMGNNIIASTALAVSVLPQATTLYRGVVIQDHLGSTHVSMFPESGKTHQKYLPELDGHKIIDARYDRGVLVVIGARKGRYDRLVIRFDKSHETYSIRTVRDVPYVGINMAVLDSGVAVLLNEDEKLELFSVQKDSTAVKIVEDAALGGDITLSSLGAQLLFVKGDRTYKAIMK